MEWKKINIRKGFTILYPQKVNVCLFPALHHGCIKREHCKKPSFAFASSILPIPVIILRRRTEQKKIKKPVHKKYE